MAPNRCEQEHPMGDRNPQPRFEQPATNPVGAESQGPDRPDRPKKSLRLLILLVIVIAGALIAALIVILVLLGHHDGGGAAPVASATFSTVPSPSQLPSPPPQPVSPPPSVATQNAPPPPPKEPSTKLEITSFTIKPAKVDCSAGAPAGAANLSISWKSLNGSAAYFGVNTADAKTGGMGWTLPAVGTQHNFPSGYDPFEYTCGAASAQYTITITASGSQQSQTVTVYRK